jgi:hypothetical protein
VVNVESVATVGVAAFRAYIHFVFAEVKAAGHGGESCNKVGLVRDLMLQIMCSLAGARILSVRAVVDGEHGAVESGEIVFLGGAKNSHGVGRARD